MSFFAYTRLFGGTCDVPPWLLRLICTIASLPSLPQLPLPVLISFPNARADVNPGAVAATGPVGHQDFLLSYFVICYHCCSSLVMDDAQLWWAPGQGSMPAEGRGSYASPDLCQAPGQVSLTQI